MDIDILPTDVKETYSTLLEEHPSKRREVKLALLYASYRICHKPMTLNELSEEQGDEKRIGRAFKRLKLNIRLPKPEEFIDRYSESLNLGEKESKYAKSVVEQARHCNDFCCVCNTRPDAVAAAAVYISSILCGNRRTQAEIEETTGITNVCLRSRYTDICKKADIKLPEGWEQ